ncbi:lipopolysaccharide biosynthesis protein [Parabacteroides sp. AF19-14]|mgnify:CR=1 FL=1|uniref:lipopolysaccharide biosynthesis protein n=1 Tax=Parabacteroides sp. AF19-14 TaxID=2293114 RepID=UPI000EFEB2B6|nr:hypothetical protein DWX33_01800 [Parabacteroides sp. AF19-14]
MPVTSENNKRIARNTLFLSIRMIFVLSLTFYTTRVILNLLGVVDYGIYNVVCGFVSMFTFLNTSMSNGIQRFYSFELGKNGEKGLNEVYNTAIILQLLLAIFLILSTESLGVWYINYKMEIPQDRLFAANWIFQLSLLNFIVIIMQVPYTAAVIAYEKMNFYAIISVLDAILKLLFIFVIPVFKSDMLIVYGVFMLLVSMVDFSLYYIYCKHCFEGIKWKFCRRNDLFKSVLVFSGWNIFGSFSGMMKEQGISLVLNLFFGPVVNAARGIAVQVNAGLQSFVSNMSISVRPQIVQSYAVGNIDRAIKLTYCISKFSCLCLYVLALPIVYNINWILKIWLGDAVPENTSTFVVVVVLISFLNNLNSAISSIVHAVGKMKLYQLSTSFFALLAIPISYVGLERGLSAVFAFWMVFITMLFVQVIAVLVLKKLMNISLKKYLKDVVLPIFLVVVLTFWIPYILVGQIEGWIKFVMTIIVSLIVNLFVIYFVGLTHYERKIVDDFINKLRL